MDWRLKEEAVNTAIFDAFLSLHKPIFIRVRRIFLKLDESWLECQRIDNLPLRSIMFDCINRKTGVRLSSIDQFNFRTLDCVQLTKRLGEFDYIRLQNTMEINRTIDENDNERLSSISFRLTKPDWLNIIK